MPTQFLQYVSDGHSPQHCLPGGRSAKSDTLAAATHCFLITHVNPEKSFDALLAIIMAEDHTGGGRGRLF